MNRWPIYQSSVALLWLLFINVWTLIAYNCSFWEAMMRLINGIWWKIIIVIKIVGLVTWSGQMWNMKCIIRKIWQSFRYLHCGCYSFSCRLGNLKVKKKWKTKQYKIGNYARNVTKTHSKNNSFKVIQLSQWWSCFRTRNSFSI